MESLIAAMPSDVPDNTPPEEDPPQLSNLPEEELLGAAMPSDVPEDTLPDSGKGGNDEHKVEALVDPEKEEVGEKMMNEPVVAVKKKFTLIRGVGAYKPPVGKKWAKPGTVAMFADEVIEPKKAKKNIIITEDPPKLKDPPELRMLLPLVPAGLDPSNVNPPSTKTDDFMYKLSMLEKMKKRADSPSGVL